MSIKTVLIVDDAYSMRSLLKKTLKEAGFEVIGEAKDGKEGVAMYSNLNPDLVTMDIAMPEMSGIEATKQIIKLNPSAKVIVVTGNNNEIIKQQILDAGALEYLKKPFQPAFLWNKLDKIFSKPTETEASVTPSPVDLAPHSGNSSVKIITDVEIENNLDNMEIEILSKPDENEGKVLIIENNEDIIEFPEEFAEDNNEHLLTEDMLKMLDEQNKAKQETSNATSSHQLKIEKKISNDQHVEESIKMEEERHRDLSENDFILPKETDLPQPQTVAKPDKFNIRPPRGRILTENLEGSSDIEEPLLNEIPKNNYNIKTNTADNLLNKVKKLFKK